MIRLFKSKKKRMSEECWNLDYELTKWLNEHLKVYLKEASTTIDLTFYKFKYKNKTYTFEEIINKLINITEELTTKSFAYENDEIDSLNKLKDQMYDLLKLVHWALWW